MSKWCNNASKYVTNALYKIKLNEMTLTTVRSFCYE